MKKLLILSVLAVLFIGVFYKHNAIDLAKFEDGTEVTFYTEKKVDYIPNAKILEGGAHRRIICKGRYAESVAKDLGEYSGFSYTYKTAGKGEEIISESLVRKFKANDVSKQKIGGIFITYAYNPRLSKSILLQGEKINLQVAVSGENVTVGYPLILGSY